MDEQEKAIERGLTRLAYLAGGIIILFILSTTGCVMHSNSYDEARMKQETEQIRADREVAKAKQQVELEQLAVFERLVQDGANPVAVRCGIEGWGSVSETVCAAAVHAP